MIDLFLVSNLFVIQDGELPFEGAFLQKKHAASPDGVIEEGNQVLYGMETSILCQRMHSIGSHRFMKMIDASARSIETSLGAAGSTSDGERQ